MKKFLIKTLFPLLRGIFKGLPMGNAIYELLENLLFKKKINTVDIKDDLQHNYKSIITQVVVMGIVIVCYVFKIITIDELMNYINVFK